MSVNSVPTIESLFEPSLWRHDNTTHLPQLRNADCSCGFDPQFMEYLLMKVPRRSKTSYNGNQPPVRRDVDSARCRKGLKTPRRYEEWRRWRQETHERLESELQDSKETNQVLTQKIENTEAENERLRVNASRLEVEKGEAKRRFLELEKARTKREEERKVLASSMHDDLQQVLEESTDLRKRLTEAERRLSAMSLLYENDAEQVAKLSFENDRLRTQLETSKEELESCKCRSDAWEEAIVSLKRERDEAQAKYSEKHTRLESMQQQLDTLYDEKSTLIQSFIKELETKHSELIKAQEHVCSMKESMMILYEELSQYKSTHVTLQQSAQFQSSELKTLQSTHKAACAHIDALILSNAKQQEENANLRSEIETLKKRLLQS